jgi:hypothetical protein
MKYLLNDIKYYVGAVKNALSFYFRNLGAALIGRNVLDRVNQELRHVLSDFAAENIRLNDELRKLAKTKPTRAPKKKDK